MSGKAFFYIKIVFQKKHPIPFQMMSDPLVLFIPIFYLPISNPQILYSEFWFLIDLATIKKTFSTCFFILVWKILKEQGFSCKNLLQVRKWTVNTKKDTKKQGFFDSILRSDLWSECGFIAKCYEKVVVRYFRETQK